MPSYIFTNRVYPPVAGATGVLLRQLAEGLARDGARVCVVTSRGPKEMDLPARETVNGVELVRAGSAPFTRRSHLRRALSYGGLYPRFFREVSRRRGVDAVISMTDPPLHAVPVVWAAGGAARRVHWAQDVYPELAEELGVLGRGGMAARLLRGLSTRALQKHDDVVAVGSCMRRRLIGRGVDATRIEVIPNWTDVLPPSPEEVRAVRERLGWGGDFVALYSGNLGLAHDFETLAGAAEELGRAGIRMVFAGDGPRREALETRLVGKASFLPPQPEEGLAAFLGAADVHLVTVGRGLDGLVVPSKFYGCAASGRPVIHVGPPDAEVAELLRGHDAGVVVNNGDTAALVRALCELRENPDRLRSMAGRSREMSARFTFREALRLWKELLET